MPRSDGPANGSASRTTGSSGASRHQGDSVFLLSVWNTFLYTFIASAAKFVLGLYLALLLNEHIPFKAFIRAIVLLPFIVPTVLSAIAFWWIYDAQFSIVSWVLVKLG
jgi:multiple sugar transport system permease protein